MTRGSSPARSVRVRTTAAATVVVALFLAVGAAGFVVLQRHQLESAVAEAARQQADDLAGQVATVTPGGPLTGTAGDQSLVQVVNADGEVLASSPTVEGEAPISAMRPSVGTVQTQTSASLPIGEGESFVVVARGAQSPEGPVTILVAQSLELVGQSTSIVIGLLLVGYPLVLAAVALTSFWLVGRALAPVEAIRARVASIQGGSTSSERVPVPDTQDEVGRLAETMNDMLARLHDASASQRRFVADASHELRSPLATIRAAHEVAALHPEIQDWGQTSAEVMAELDRVDALVADLLLLARADEHGLPMTPTDVDVDDLLLLEGRRLSRMTDLEVVVDAPPVRVVADTHQLARALRNLTDNAARHAAARIELRVRSSGGSATIEVLDDGPGVPPAERERVFDRFVRLDQSRARSHGGTGLGLSIAREIAESLGGSLSLDDTPVGARFKMTIPGAGLGPHRGAPV